MAKVDRTFLTRVAERIVEGIERQAQAIVDQHFSIPLGYREIKQEELEKRLRGNGNATIIE